MEREVAALESTQDFADETGIDISDARPCIATLYYEGMASESVGRKPCALIVGLELKVCGLSIDNIARHLESFNARCAPPMSHSTLAAVVRSLEKKDYRYRYGCDKLQAWCCGSTVCPVRRSSGASPSLCRKSGFTAFSRLGWIRYLRGSPTKVYLALLALRIQKGKLPDEPFTFYFSQLETHSGVSRSQLRQHLETLKKVGLLSLLEIGPPWKSSRRKRTVVRLASPTPDPELLGLRPLRAREG